MLSKESPELLIERQTHELKELEARSEELKTHINKIFEEVGITPEELNAMLQKSENFSPDEWNAIQKQTKEVENRLNEEKDHTGKFSHSSQSRKELSELQRHWIFVK